MLGEKPSKSEMLRAQGGGHPGPGANPSQDTITHTFTPYRQFGNAKQPTAHGGNQRTRRKPLKHEASSAPSRAARWVARSS
ncbi:hypothetical protein PDJAM_G00164590 [Pangasius djambal]|uniref:Uncharacterized protein n=1 Tax=Pangasius djambal TaxID=1691987 RepID=A0ACC5ZK47_9TELE|nr:hypothetical protein [Pangasius djambal]